MSQTPGFTYEGPNNIVIVPTVSFSKTSQNKLDNSTQQAPLTGSKMASRETIKNKSAIKPTPIKEPSKSTLSVEQQLEQLMTGSKPVGPFEDSNKNIANVEDMNKIKKVNSWASNYLQSIGHNNLKPIKINLSNNNEKVKTISAKVNETKIFQQTPAKNTTSYGVLKTAKNVPELSKLNEKTFSKHSNVGIIESLHPAKVKCTSRTNAKPDVHVKTAGVIPHSKNIISRPNLNTIDAIYSYNNNSKVSAYSTVLAKGYGEQTNCYNDGRRGIDIYDAIKSKVTREIAIEKKTRMMNLPNHKEMCEDFIKEINKNKSSKSERKKDHPQSKLSSMNSPSPSTADKKIVPSKKKIPTTKTEEKLKSSSKKEVKLQAINKNTSKSSKKDLIKKCKASLKIDKLEKKQKQHDKRHQLDIPIIKIKDYDNLSKLPIDKERVRLTQTESPERQKLKRIRTTSEELHSSNSAIHMNNSIESVVQISEKCQMNPSKRQCLEEKIDLRSKLSRVNERIYKKTSTQRNINAINNISKPPEKITIENKTDEKQKSPKNPGLKNKMKKCKKLKLIINVVCQGSDDETTSSDSSCSDTEITPTHNMDLSFLDDFNVDEIVDSLKHSPKHKIKSPLHHKMEENNKKPSNPQLNLTKILNILNAKSQANKFNSVDKINCKIEETIKNNSSTKFNTENKTNLATDDEISKIQYKKANINTIKQNFTQNANLSKDALVNILSDTKSQLYHQKTTSPEKRKHITETKGFHEVIIKNQEGEPASEDNRGIIKDESIIIYEPEISIIDLTDEHIDDTSKSNNISICAKPKQRQRLINKRETIFKANNQPARYSSGNAKGNQRLENNLKSEPNTRRITNCGIGNMKAIIENKKSKAKENDVEVVDNTLGKREDIFVDLTDDIVEDETNCNQTTNGIVKSLVENQNNKALPGSENSKEYINHRNEDIHLIPLPDSVDFKLKENNDPVEIQLQKNKNQKEIQKNNDVKELTDKNHAKEESLFATNCKTVVNLEKEIQANIAVQITEKESKQFIKTNNEHGDSDKKELTDKNIAVQITEKESKEFIENSKTNNEHGDSDIKELTNKNDAIEVPLFTSNHKTVVNLDTEKILNKTTTTSQIVKETPKTSADNLSETNKDHSNKVTKENIPKDNSNIISQVLQTKAAEKVIKNIVKIVWDTENETENIKSNECEENKIDCNKIEKELENTLKSNTDSKNEAVKRTGKKDKNESCLDQRKDLAVHLEQSILMYLQKDIKIIKFIHKGKYSSIYSCKDSSGQTFAVKVLPKNIKKKKLLQEKIIRQLQRDIPKQNLNTVYLIDVFAVQKQWCLLMEFYPKTLQQALNSQPNMKPFHIDQVQGLARQLISAVMVLRNSEIIHSDIKPSHIMLNATCDRLKLCGFDAAYNGQFINPLPNIGTGNYRAPEVILGFSAGHSIDVWSTALVIYEMATNQSLFNGFYNNEILHKQMCTFGNLPRDMVEASPFKMNHFVGRTFMRRVGIRGQNLVPIQNFFRTRRMQNSLMEAYDNHWATMDMLQRDSDMFKLNALQRLLEQMLLLDPRLRLAIEFVCADPFVYEMYM